MYTLSTEQFAELLSNTRNQATFELRERDGALVQQIGKHEIEILRAQKSQIVEGIANKRGFRYVRLLVHPTVARKLLLRMISGPTVPRAAASKTYTSQHIGKGTCYSHRRNDYYAPTVRAAGTGVAVGKALRAL